MILQKVIDFWPDYRYNNQAKCAGVAQSVVHLTRNEKVACSSQVTSSNHERTILYGSSFLYKENHSLYEWFKKAYGDEQETPVTTTERSANCSKLHNRDFFIMGINDTVDYSRQHT